MWVCVHCGYKEDISVLVDIGRVKKVEVLVDSGPTCNIIEYGLL